MGYPQINPYVKGPTPQPSSDRLFIQKELDKIQTTIQGLIDAIVSLQAITHAGGATTSILPAGESLVVKDSTGGSVKLVYNDGGTLKSVTLT